MAPLDHAPIDRRRPPAVKRRDGEPNNR